MEYIIENFTEKHLKPACELFINNYKREQSHMPLLPSGIINKRELVMDTIRSRISNPRNCNIAE